MKAEACNAFLTLAFFPFCTVLPSFDETCQIVLWISGKCTILCCLEVSFVYSTNIKRSAEQAFERHGCCQSCESEHHLFVNLLSIHTDFCESWF